MRYSIVGSPLPNATVDLRHVQVDVESLEDFRAVLGRELDVNLRPNVLNIQRDHGLGVGFGVRNPGGRIQAARQRYHRALVAATVNLAGYVAAAEVLIDAIRRVAAAYRDADAASAARVARINAELDAALLAALGARRKAQESAREQETERELRRMYGTHQ
jgi:hypothetical protein